MKDIAVSDLIDLIVADVPDAEGRIQKMFEWHFARDLEIVKWVLGVAASFAVAFGIALFNAKESVPWGAVAVLSVIPVSVASYGLLRLYRMRSIHKQYLAALKLLAKLRAVKSFIVRYRTVAER